jgi:NAD-dependent dihydropyrimidine dehydrogenase PreA subunit
MTMDKGMNADIVPCSARPIRFDAGLCTGCNRCMEVCQVDVFLPNPEAGAPPVVVWPGECYYCGSCVQVCPRPGAISLSHPLMNRTRFVPGEGTDDDKS